MAINRGQRIGIWVILILLIVGTIGGFIAMVFAPQNAAKDQAKFNQLVSDYQKAQTEYQEKLTNYWKDKNAQYFEEFKQYKDSAASFDKSQVTELVKNDLKVGDGADLTKDSTFTAYYIGWNSSGEVFDSSFNDAGDGLKDPFTASAGQVIQGWTDGVEGMKVGGIRELTIPSSLAYGETGSGDKIPANEPLKFILFVVPADDAPTAPEMPEELLKYYQTGSF